MFENLLFQDRAARQLASMVQQDRVPPVLLFTGPEASGKLTAGLELARVLSCEKNGAWNCDCQQCMRHRSLTNPDLLLFGPRDIIQEPRVTADFFLRLPSQSSWYAFIRSVRKLLKRFDPLLWEGEESRISKAVPALESIEEMIQELGQQSRLGRLGDLNENTIPQKAQSLVEKIVESAAGLESAVPDGIPVFMVRNMSSWAAMSPSGRTKLVIIQNADTAGESARNAMLKILEEPPPTVRFVLTASRRATVIATILSRARLIAFEHRTPQQAQAIVSRLFKIEEEVRDLGEFFRRRSSFSPEQADSHARLFLGALLAEWAGREQSTAAAAAADTLGNTAGEIIKLAIETDANASSILRKLSDETAGFGSKNPAYADSFIVFMRALTRLLQNIAADPSSPAVLIMYLDRISRRIREIAAHYRSLNRSPELMLEAFAGMFGGIDESSL